MINQDIQLSSMDR